jgi:DivIVA domain-containing protein
VGDAYQRRANQVIWSAVVHTQGVVDTERTEGRSDNELPSREPGQGSDFGELRDYVPADIRDVSFPGAVRGYDRQAVDAYVKRINTVIAELEVSRSPHAAVRHALDRVGRQTSGILQQARETADEMSASAWAEADRTTARANTKAEEISARANAEADETVTRAKAEAEETTARAKAEAEEVLARTRTEAAERLQRLEQEIATLQEEAETRLRKLDTDTEAVWRQRTELVDETRELAARLEAVASEAAARFPGPQPSGPDEAVTQSGSSPASAPPDPDDRPNGHASST